jgi:hypothetical protein
MVSLLPYPEQKYGFTLFLIVCSLILKTRKSQSVVEEDEGMPMETIECSIQPETLDISKQLNTITLDDKVIQHDSISNNLSYEDSFARPSRLLKKSFRAPVSGDGDIWVEELFRNKISGTVRSFFCSIKTGTKRKDEPPTGASKVIYLY